MNFPKEGLNVDAKGDRGAIRDVEKVAKRVNRANNIAGTGRLGEFGGFLLNQPDPQFGRKVAFI